MDGSRRVTRRNRKSLRKFETDNPDGMNAQQTQTPQDGLSGMVPRAIAHGEPLLQLDKHPASMRETPVTALQLIHQPTTPVGTNN